MTAESAYMSALFGILALVLWAGSVDITLWARSEMTISQWLRGHQAWVMWPMSVVLVSLAALILHLFIFTE
jgi:hypothetical protein